MKCPDFLLSGIKTLFAITFFSILFSCSLKKEQAQYIQANQPGSVIHVYLDKNSSRYQDTNTALKDFEGTSEVAKKVKRYKNEIEALYAQGILQLGINGNSSPDASTTLSVNQAQATALFALFPIDTAKWMKIISTQTDLSKNEVYEAAIAAGLDPTVVFAASASGFEDVATPLINSIGLVIYGQDENSTTQVRFKKQDEAQWQAGLPLAWEPVYGAFAGSIVYLDAATLYDIEVEITDAYGASEVYRFQRATKPNSPPIDPDKIYYLSEIYTDGQLDLEALNISGSPDGYAKIIGDGPIVKANEGDLAAVNIGSQSYVMLENITTEGGLRYGIFGRKTHHVWIKGCNVSGYGRVAGDIRDNVAYSSPTANSPINYDSGIYLERSGIAVIEECEVHSPNLGANHWGDGHPKGANALQVWAYHDEERYRGEFIVRNNRFYGSQNHRFNDVIEGRKNFERRGGFVKNSAIYGNYLAYANDDLIEIDGGQQNVLVYNNEMEQGYAGVSIAPNMLGPSYIFHNHIHNLGDQTGKQWTAIKAGGLMAKPAGKTYVFENFIDVGRNGIAASGVNGDTSFWIETQNNVILTANTGYSVGYCIFDDEKYYKNTSTNDLCFNRKTMDARYEFNLDNVIEHPNSDDLGFIELLVDSLTNGNVRSSLPISEEFQIPNFSVPVFLPIQVTKPNPLWHFNANEIGHSGFANQHKYGSTTITNDNTVTLTGNNWRKFPIDYVLSEQSILHIELTVEGIPELVGVAFETDNQLTNSRVIKFYGTQTWNIGAENEFQLPTSSITFPIGQYITGRINYLVLLLDNDEAQRRNNTDKAIFHSIKVTEVSK